MEFAEAIGALHSPEQDQANRMTYALSQGTTQTACRAMLQQVKAQSSPSRVSWRTK